VSVKFGVKKNWSFKFQIVSYLASFFRRQMRQWQLQC